MFANATNRFACALHADVIAGFAFDEDSGNVHLEKASNGQMAFVSRPELEVSQLHARVTQGSTLESVKELP